jgi:hypothetical protein
MKDFKVGDIVENYGLNFSPLKWWEKMYYIPKWKIKDFCYYIKKQYHKCRYGFPLEQSWNFSFSCAEWALPRLKQLRNNLNGHPSSLMVEGDDLNSTTQMFFPFFSDIKPTKDKFETWKEIIDKIIWSMEHIQDDVEPIKPENFDSHQVVISTSNSTLGFSPIDNRPWDWSPVLQHQKRLQEGFDLFGKHFLDLWD